MEKVFFTDMQTKPNNSLLNKFAKLIKKSGVLEKIKPKMEVAIKLHWGEPGNLSYIHPLYIRVLVNLIKKQGAYPFITDTNTIYRGPRNKATTNIEVAIKHGFNYSVLDAPVIIADGIKGKSYITIPVKNGFKLDEIKIGNALYWADFVFVVSHFKGHILYGFGGAIKNIVMGFAPQSFKQVLHSDMKPEIKQDKCVGCGNCAKICPAGAIVIKNKKALINQEKCIGCGECIVVCPTSAIPVQWKTDIEPLYQKTADFINAVWENMKEKIFCINFLINLNPNCDCMGWNEPPLLEDIGILATHNPVIIDKVSLDLIIKKAGKDVFKEYHKKDYYILFNLLKSHLVNFEKIKI